ncbi:MAG: sigma factor-like helix-turn-helix DNA-binding protein [Gemmatimonadota bacterium]
MDDESSALPIGRRPTETTEQYELATLYKALRRNLRVYASNLLGKKHNRQDAEDVVHDAVARFIEQRANATHPMSREARRSKLVLMVGDAARSRARSARREVRLIRRESGSNVAASRWMNPRRRNDDGEIRRAIYGALKKLPNSWADPWLLMREDDLSIKEASELLDVSEGTVRAAVCRATAALREILTKDGYSVELLNARTDQ